MFIYCSFVFDLYKWCIFIAATGTTISGNNDVLKARQTVLLRGLVVVQILIILVSLTFIIGILATSTGRPYVWVTSENASWQQN